MTALSIYKPSHKKQKVYGLFLQAYLSDGQGYYTALRDTYEEAGRDVEKLITLQIARAEGRELPEGWVPVTTLWMEEAGKIIGEAVIRHDLNCAVLEEFAGHVTYYILPEHRGKGLAKRFMKWIVDEAREIGIEDLRLHCDQENVASQKVLEACGAKLVDTLDNLEEWGEMTNRYSLEIRYSQLT